MILCVTLNPVVDTTLFVNEIRPVYRTEAYRITHLAGGKGNNVARALTGLGEPARVLTPLGGAAGRYQAELLAADGLEAVIAWVSGETRVVITVVDQAHSQRARRRVTVCRMQRARDHKQRGAQWGSPAVA
jgi:fructose-1-phosphate kinase PfkB-like protein